MGTPDLDAPKGEGPFYENRDDPICPWCGATFDAGNAYHEDAGELECPECYQPIKFYAYRVYVTSKVNENEVPK